MMDEVFMGEAEKQNLIRRTADGSATLFSVAYREAYHSLSGAESEAFDKYVAPCGIERLAKKGEMRLLDVGLGLGYNLIAAIHVARAVNPECRVEAVSLEKEVVPFAALEEIGLPPVFLPYSSLLRALLAEGVFEGDNLSLRLIIGDAREGILDATGKFNAVFLDAFSPKKNPELWTVEFFRQLHSRMTSAAILATYSSATPVRCGLVEAGFRIGPGPGDGMKRGGTLATKEGAIPPLPEKEFLRLSRSPEAFPYRDRSGASSATDILGRRERAKEIRK